MLIKYTGNVCLHKTIYQKKHKECSNTEEEAAAFSVKDINADGVATGHRRSHSVPPKLGKTAKKGGRTAI